MTFYSGSAELFQDVRHQLETRADADGYLGPTWKQDNDAQLALDILSSDMFHWQPTLRQGLLDYLSGKLTDAPKPPVIPSPTNAPGLSLSGVGAWIGANPIVAVGGVIAALLLFGRRR